MDITEAVVGGCVLVNGGFGSVEGKTVKIDGPCLYVETVNFLLRFNYDGKECGPNGKAYDYAFDITDGPGPWEIVPEDWKP